MAAIDRLYEYMNERGMKPAQMEKMLGLSNGYLSKQYNRKGGLGEGILNQILDNCPGMSPEWLLTGNEDRSKSKSKEAQHTFHSVSTTPIYEPTFTEKIIPEQTIPLYSFDATAGILVNADNSAQYKLGDIFIPGMPRCDGAIHITGDSMYPLLKSGDIIAFKEIYDKENIFWGEMYLLFIDEYGDEYITVKYVHKAQDDKHIKLVSENPTHAPREVERKHIRALALVKLSIRFNTMR